MLINRSIFPHLCLFARCRRYSAFILAAPEPCAPVMYAFFLALVFIFLSALGFEAPLLNVIPCKIVFEISSIHLYIIRYRGIASLFFVLKVVQLFPLFVLFVPIVYEFDLFVLSHLTKFLRNDCTAVIARAALVPWPWMSPRT